MCATVWEPLPTTPATRATGDRSGQKRRILNISTSALPTSSGLSFSLSLASTASCAQCPSLTVSAISLSGCQEGFIWHYGFWLGCCFDFIFLLQELGTKGRGHFPISLTQESMPSCQSSSRTCTKKLWWNHCEMCQKREMQTENSRFWAYAHLELSHVSLFCLYGAFF